MLHINKGIVLKLREKNKRKIYSSLSGKDKALKYHHSQILSTTKLGGGAKLRKVLREQDYTVFSLFVRKYQV